MGWVGWVFSSLATWLPGCLVSGGRKAVTEMFPVQAQRSFLKSVVKDWTLFEREVGDVLSFLSFSEFFGCFFLRVFSDFF